MAFLRCDKCGSSTDTQGSWDTIITILCTKCSIKARENAPKPLPMFVMMVFENGEFALRKIGNKYYRDGGDWSVDFTHKENELVSKSDMKHLNQISLVETTEKKWRACNGVYAPDLGAMELTLDDESDIVF